METPEPADQPDTTPDPAPPPDDTPPADAAPAPDEAPEGWKPPTYAELQALQAERDAAQAAKRRAEKAAQTKETAGKKEAGKFEELYNESEAKLGKVTQAVSRTFVNSEVTAAAARLGFRDPGDAARLIDTSGIEADVELEGDAPKIEVSQASKAMIERRLTELATRSRYLIDESRARQSADAGGAASGRNSSPDAAGGHGDMNAAIRRAAGRA